MKMKFLALLAAAGVCLALTGCVGTVDGRSKAGFPFLHDKVTGRYERPSSQVFEASKAVLGTNGMGTLVAENTINKSLEARVQQSTVYVKVDEEDPAKPVTRVTVQVRSRGGVTDVNLAHEVEKQIALKLVTMH